MMLKAFELVVPSSSFFEHIFVNLWSDAIEATISLSLIAE